MSDESKKKLIKGGTKQPKVESKEINEIIDEFDKQILDDPPYKSCIGDKIIPYIGWFWRTVNFDKDHCWLGVLPILDEDGTPCGPHDTPRVGFLENNKWNYSMFKIEGDKWQILRTMIGNAVMRPTKERFREVDLYMQSLLPEQHR